MTREQKAILAATPGRLLQEEFIEAHQLSQSELSRRTGIPRSSINEIVKGKRAITAETAFKCLIDGTVVPVETLWAGSRPHHPNSQKTKPMASEKSFQDRVQKSRDLAAGGSCG